MSDTNYTLEVKTVDYDARLKCDADLVLAQRNVDSFEFNCTTIIKVISEHGFLTVINWHNYGDSEVKTILLSQTEKLFFGIQTLWGIINLRTQMVETLETCFDFWDFELHDDVVVVITELQVYAMHVNGYQISSVSVDPPFERKNLKDGIEFTSLTSGRQVLKFGFPQARARKRWWWFSA